MNVERIDQGMQTEEMDRSDQEDFTDSFQKPKSPMSETKK